MKILWTEFAEMQLDGIYHFIGQRNEPLAVRIYNDILNETETLQNFPRMAQREPLLSDFPEEYRALIVRRTYKVVYYIENEAIINVVAVFDCRQNPDKLAVDISTARN